MSYITKKIFKKWNDILSVKSIPDNFTDITWPYFFLQKKIVCQIYFYAKLIKHFLKYNHK